MATSRPEESIAKDEISFVPGPEKDRKGSTKSEGTGLREVNTGASEAVGTIESATSSCNSRWRRGVAKIYGPFSRKEGKMSTFGNAKKKPFNFRHHQMLNLTSGIGMGLFVTSGRQLAIGGPASLLINNILMTLWLYVVSCNMCEMGMRYPISGSFVRYSSRFVNPAHGFALGWIYFFAYLFTFGAESNAIAFTLRYWAPDAKMWAVALCFLAVILLIHIAPPHIFAEVEFCIGSFRVLSVTGFIIWTICMMCGLRRGDTHPTPKFGEYYRRPGPFQHGYQGLVNAAILAAFSNGGVEIAAVASGDVIKPRFSIPRTVQAFKFRMSLFYILSLFCITLLLSSDDARLQGDQEIISPFVYSLEIYGYPALAHIFNINIFLSVLSVANCCMYVCGQMLFVMAEDGYAPKWFGVKDSSGKPERAIYVSFLLGCAVVMAAAFSTEAFEWLASNTGMVFLIVWLSINTAHMFYRRAIQVQGDPDEKTPFLYRMRWSEVQNITALVVGWFLLIGQIDVAASPLEGKATANTFFKGCLPLLAWVVLIAGYMIYKKSFLTVKPQNINLLTDLAPEDANETYFIQQYRKIKRWRRLLTYIPFVTIPIHEKEDVNTEMSSTDNVAADEIAVKTPHLGSA